MGYSVMRFCDHETNDEAFVTVSAPGDGTTVAKIDVADGPAEIRWANVEPYVKWMAVLFSR